MARSNEILKQQLEAAITTNDIEFVREMRLNGIFPGPFQIVVERHNPEMLSELYYFFVADGTLDLNSLSSNSLVPVYNDLETVLEFLEEIKNETRVPRDELITYMLTTIEANLAYSDVRDWNRSTLDKLLNFYHSLRGKSSLDKAVLAENLLLYKSGILIENLLDRGKLSRADVLLGMFYLSQDHPGYDLREIPRNLLSRIIAGTEAVKKLLEPNQVSIFEAFVSDMLTEEGEKPTERLELPSTRKVRLPSTRRTRLPAKVIEETPRPGISKQPRPVMSKQPPILDNEPTRKSPILSRRSPGTVLPKRTSTITAKPNYQVVKDILATRIPSPGFGNVNRSARHADSVFNNLHGNFSNAEIMAGLISYLQERQMTLEEAKPFLPQFVLRAVNNLTLLPNDEIIEKVRLVNPKLTAGEIEFFL